MESKSSSETTRGTTITGTTGSAPAHPTTGDAIDMLLQDHTTIKSLLEQINNDSGQEQKHQALEQLKELLTIHNATEENFVYPALAKVAGHQHESEHLYHETALADMTIFELDTCMKTGDMDGFASNAKKLREAVLEHIDDEEKKAFPQLRKEAEPEQTAMLNRSVSKFRSSLHFTKA